MNRSGLTSKMICNNQIYGAIPMYLRPGETTEAMIAKFKGNLVKAIQFLRDRAFESEVASSSFPEDHIMHPKHDPVYNDLPASKPKRSKSKPNNNKPQKSLF